MPNSQLDAAIVSDADARSRIPHLEQYFGVWAIQEEPFRAAVDRVRGLDLAVHLQEQDVERQGAGPRPIASAASPGSLATWRMLRPSKLPRSVAP